MVQISNLWSFGLATVVSLAAAAPTNCLDGLCLKTRANLSPLQVSRELGPLLSNASSVFGPSDSRWANATARYQQYAAPKFTVAVQVARESDVSVIIKYANRNSLPFYAVNRGHGLPISQAKFSGLEIDMQLLTGITIQSDGKSALFQGGTYDQQVMDTLWEEGYVATTGSCGCVGMLGPALGGGHGRQQGFHGLISDNILKLNVVLADGTTATVSNTSHMDLFWAMRGAGHNFGVVTSFEMSIYPTQVHSWYYKNYVFTQDKLEDLFEQLNVLQGNGTQPVKMAAQYGIYMVDSTVSATEAIIWWTFGYAGSQSEAQQYLTPFDNLNPFSSTDGNVPFPEVPNIQGTGINNATCDKGLERIVGPAGLQVYNATAQRQIYDLFNKNVNSYPALAASAVVMEGYSVEAVRNVDSDSSAYPMRDDYLLMQTTISYSPNSTLDNVAIDWVTENQKFWNEGQPTRKPTAYVNYASGRESLEAIYGYEPWRLERLRKLKAKYDPEGRFSYYNPIV
ncbi:CAZyme family AA7 [Penicillium samsonianum]|uniref:CAZyme family AA7 n=1 Tax=Penicillium samsonianum TaxID=1882272 RepID=UPI002548EDC7|nr:CAZyme family AA7 [Penicillium samsonianum]KAJ6128717.1 CAZyme family AA7 [Penicillium samsonianum]